MLKETYFESADFFLARCALLPKNQTIFMPETLLAFYKENPIFQEAIAIASPSLKESLGNYLLHGKGNLTKLYSSLLRYFLRMSSRATPFGLFSAVGWGKFESKTNLHFSYSSLHKKIRPDMEWMKTFIDSLEIEQTIAKFLKVMTAPHLIKKGAGCL